MQKVKMWIITFKLNKKLDFLYCIKRSEIHTKTAKPKKGAGAVIKCLG